VQDEDEVVQEWMLLPKGKQYGWMVLLDTSYQPVRLRLSAKSVSQPEVFFLTENQPAVLSASQISPSEQAGGCWW
jgi:hypothetical protein